MKRRVYAATKPEQAVLAAGADNASEAFEDAMGALKADFDYVMDGFEKLAREGKEGQDAAMQLVLELKSAVNGVGQKVASSVVK